jgi:murein tripeptide amidase MpaA
MLKSSIFDRDEDFEMLSPDNVLVWANKEQQGALEQNGLKPTPGEDPNAPFDLAQMANYTYSSGAQDWAQYCNYDCMLARLQDISAECGWALESIGQSVQGREIWVMTVGPTSDPKVLVASNIHGDEQVGGQLNQRWLWESCFEPTAEQTAIATTMTTAWMPMMSPDGHESIRRNNANNRDLNRDFPIPGQSPTRDRQVETVAYMDYVAAHPSLRTSMMYHGKKDGCELCLF